MSKITVAEIIPSAFSKEQAEILKEEIDKCIDNDEKIIIDFTGVKRYTTLFFNFSLGFFLNLFGEEYYESRFEIIGLNELGKNAYQHSYDNVVRADFKGDNHLKEQIRQIISNNFEE